MQFISRKTKNTLSDVFVQERLD